MFEYMAYPALLVASLGLILLACELFTNGIEWAGKRLDLSDGATGSVLAAVGTALPETSIPVIALLAGGESRTDVAVGAIAGSPFMLSTLAFFVSGAAYFYFSRKGKRPKSLAVDVGVITRDLGFFLVIYSAAFLMTFVPSHGLRLMVALCMVLSYGYYLYRTLGHKGAGAGELEELHLCRALHMQTRTVFISLQVLASLVMIAAGAHFFVVAVQHTAALFGVPVLLLSLIITPIATELPEKMNSVLWIRDGKDTLALGNITGAMVFQASFPVAIGVAFTPWDLAGPTMVSAVIALSSAGLGYITLKLGRSLPPRLLLAGGAFYAAFIVYLLAGQ